MSKYDRQKSNYRPSHSHSHTQHPQQYKLIYDSSLEDRRQTHHEKRNDDRFRDEKRNDNRFREDKRNDDRFRDEKRNDDRFREDRKRSRSRSPPKPKPPSPQILNAILEGHISESLEVVNKSYKHMAEDFKIKPEIIHDPFDFTVLPVLILPSDISELIESSRTLRLQSKIRNRELAEAKLKVIEAELKVHESDATLNAIKAQINNYSL
ncbi:unnamed protein product [Blepharisma stoltei]|uniref:Uncharacterized protein n=1 Tax=Blepharisma stoltei TaxID=1481888 RepID=A0AAU9IYP0_9CILI|nr:unnamed protein product [Blepharisma stoltei]